MPAAAVAYMAQQVKVPARARADYHGQGDRIKRHRKEIREAYGFRANTEEDERERLRGRECRPGPRNRFRRGVGCQTVACAVRAARFWVKNGRSSVVTWGT